jgi:hypothetical protein
MIDWCPLAAPITIPSESHVTFIGKNIMHRAGVYDGKHCSVLSSPKSVHFLEDLLGSIIQLPSKHVGSSVPPIVVVGLHGDEPVVVINHVQPMTADTIAQLSTKEKVAFLEALRRLHRSKWVLNGPFHVEQLLLASTWSDEEDDGSSATVSTTVTTSSSSTPIAQILPQNGLFRSPDKSEKAYASGAIQKLLFPEPLEQLDEERISVVRFAELEDEEE